MTAEVVQPYTVPPAWVLSLTGEHWPRIGPWTCNRCTDNPAWPCAIARAHLVDGCAVGPHAGLVLLRWCYAGALADLPREQYPGRLRAEMVGWYEPHMERAYAYRGNRPHVRRWTGWGRRLRPGLADS